MNQLVQNVFNYKTWQLFLTITGITLLLSFIIQLRILDYDVFVNLVGKQLSISQIDEMFKMQTEYSWLGYVLAPIVLLLKTTFAAFFIHMILVLVEYDIPFKDAFKLNLIAGSVFLGVSVVQAIVLYTVEASSITQETLQLMSVSLAHVVEKESVITPLYAFLGVINPYEIVYVIITVLGIKHITKESTKKSTLVTGMIWGIFTLFVIVVQSFIELNMQ